MTLDSEDQFIEITSVKTVFDQPKMEVLWYREE